MKRIVLFFVMIAAVSSAATFADEKPLIVSTIRPIQALTVAITGDYAETQQLIPDYASPHHYSLKPSEVRLLNKADLVIRIDDHLETFLEKSLGDIAPEKLVTLSSIKTLTLLSAEHHDHDETHEEESHEEHAHEEHAHEDEHHHDEEHDESELDKESTDYHLWLSPKNAELMAEYIRDRVIAVDPTNEATYTSNTQALIAAIKQSEEEIQKTLSTVKDTPFLVMHDAWQYFTNYFQLKQLDSITLQERLKPSAKAIREARQTIADSNVRCIVTERGFKLKTLRVLTEDMPVNTTEIDPMGRHITLSEQAYPALLDYTAKQLVECLSNPVQD